MGEYEREWEGRRENGREWERIHCNGERMHYYRGLYYGKYMYKDLQWD